MSVRSRSIQSPWILIWQAQAVTPRSAYLGTSTALPAGRTRCWRSICPTVRVP